MHNKHTPTPTPRRVRPSTFQLERLEASRVGWWRKVCMKRGHPHLSRVPTILAKKPEHKGLIQSALILLEIRGQETLGGSRLASITHFIRFLCPPEPPL